MAQPANVDALLTRIRVEIDRRDYYAAVQAYRQAAAAPNRSAAQNAGLQQLRQRFGAIGIDGALLSLPPQTPIRRSSGCPTSWAPNRSRAFQADMTPKQQALRLVALGRASLDRGEVSNALSLAKQAEALQVPASDFNPGDPRPWQLLLDAESAARSKGIALTGATQPAFAGATQTQSAGAVQPAMANSSAGDVAFVQQMLYTSDASANRGSENGVQQVQAVDPLPPDEQGQQAYGQQLFNAGLDALTRGEKEKAREQFKEAWQYQTDLTPAQRNQLKDKLTLLQPKRLASPAASSNVELTPIQKAELEKQQKMRRLYREVTSELAKAEESKTSSPLNSLDQLQRLSRRVADSDIDDQSRYSLAKMVDRAINDQKQYVEANRADIDLELRNEQIRAERESDQMRDLQIDDEVKTLVDSFNKLMDEKRYAEAEMTSQTRRRIETGSSNRRPIGSYQSNGTQYCHVRRHPRSKAGSLPSANE